MTRSATRNMGGYLKNSFAMSMVLLLVLVVPIVVAMFSSWLMSEETLGYRDRVLSLAALASTIFSNSSSMLSVDRFVYEVRVLISNNMSVSVDRDGFLTIYLVNRGGEKLYEDFTWIVQGYTPRDFPKRFRGVVEPRSRAMVYRAYLPTILNRTGEYEVIIMSSEVLVFNVSMSSPEEVLRVKELAPRITPILRIECTEPRPKVCKVSLPKYSLYLKVRVELNPEKLRHLQVIEKPPFIDIEFANNIEDVLRVLGNDDFFREMWSGKNITAVLVYLENRGDRNLTMVGWGGYEIRIVDPSSDSVVGRCGIRAQVLKPNIVVVKPGERKLFDLYIIEYRGGTIYINGFDCGKIEPGTYIVEIYTQTKPHIHIKISMEFKTVR